MTDKHFLQGLGRKSDPSEGVAIMRSVARADEEEEEEDMDNNLNKKKKKNKDEKDKKPEKDKNKEKEKKGNDKDKTETMKDKDKDNDKDKDKVTTNVAGHNLLNISNKRISINFHTVRDRQSALHIIVVEVVKLHVNLSEKKGLCLVS